MIVHAGAETGTRLTDEQILAHTKILLVAGHETTTHLGAWTLYLLATHSEYRQKVEEELAHEVGDGPLTYEHVRGLPILTNAIKEAGRLYSPVHAVPRGVIKPFVLGEYGVPIGERVYIAIGATHRLPDIFADPGQFDPDRFAPPRDEERRTPYGLITFGGGQRVCIGINFAQIEVKAFVAHVLRRFDLLPAPGGSPSQWNGITAFIPGGIHVRVAARRYDDSTTSSRHTES
jgi:cytochrome P450